MDELRIDLAAFRGPLDLLLHLVQQEEVEIQDLPISKIADRFLQVCKAEVHSLDVDRAGEYLVMASHLLVIKSRALLPRDEPEDIEDIDPRLDLVRQLLEYRDFKAVSNELAARFEEERLKSAVRVRPTGAQIDPAEEPIEVDLYALVSAFQTLLAETGDTHSVAMARERLPITHYVGQIFDRLLEIGGRLSFRELIGRVQDRSYVIGAFLALLELIKLRKVRAVQDGLGDIQLELTDEALALGESGGQVAAAQAIDLPDIVDAPREGPRIVFMGSPAFAVPALRRLAQKRWAPVLVIAPPARPAGRGRRAQASAVQQAAEELQIPVHRTIDVNVDASMREIAAAQPDVIVTAAFGQKLGRALLALPRYGCLNIHASLLPRYRGASPIAAAIRDGAKEIGVSVFRMTPGWDRGPVLGVRGAALGPDTTLDEATLQLAEMGGDLLLDVLPAYLEGELEPVPQDESGASYVPRLEKRDGVIDWAQPARAVHDFIRSVTSWPGAQTAWQPRVRHEPLAVLVAQSEVFDELRPFEGESRPKPGEVLGATRDGIDVACATGILRILRLRPAGGRDMNAADFLNARRVVVGDRFVPPPENS